MSTDTVQLYETVRKFAEGWSSHDPGKLAAIFTEDCFYEDVVLNVAARGRQEVGQFLLDWCKSSSDLHMRLTHQFGEGNRVGAEWVFTGHLDGEDLDGIPATGKPFEFRGSTLFEFEGDQIKWCIDYWNLMAVARQTA
jgi:steroid delta-isomerase-like uncharacterized protein